MEYIGSDLAQDIEKYGELYDRSHKHYANYERRAAIWKALSSIYNVNAKSKWNATKWRLWRETRTGNLCWTQIEPYLHFIKDHLPTQQDDIRQIEKQEEELSDDGLSLTENGSSSLCHFVQEVERHAELYDRDDKYANHKTRKDRLWKMLSAKYKFDAESKWNLLRDNFAKEKRKGHTSWNMYAYLAFLDKYENSREAESETHEAVVEEFIDGVEEVEIQLVDEQESSQHCNSLALSDEDTDLKGTRGYFMDTEVSLMELSTNEVLYSFVQEVEARRELYDKAHRQWGNAERKKAIWKALSLKYHINAKAKWDIMRERFTREKRKPHSDWHLYPYLYFLGPHIQHRHKRLKILPEDCVENDMESSHALDIENVNNNNLHKLEQIEDELTIEEHEELTQDITASSVVMDYDEDNDKEDLHFLESLKYTMRKMKDEEKTVFKIEMLLEADKAVANTKKKLII